MSMRKFPKIRQPGHRENHGLFDGEVVVQEKVDGSNFSFWLDDNGELHCASRSQELNLSGDSGMFRPAVDYLLSRLEHLQDACRAGIIFRCEYLQKPKHNVLAYGRLPTHHLALFDLDVIPGYPELTFRGERAFLEADAKYIGIDVVPELYRGPIRPETLKGWFSTWETTESFLGGQKIEGVVLKNYAHTNEHGHILQAKMVRAEFKEQHTHIKRLEKTDPANEIGQSFGGPARWRKAVQSLRDAGLVIGQMEDMPMLLRKVRVDVEEECVDEIKERLWKHYRKNVLGATTRGLGEWYQSYLNAFDEDMAAIEKHGGATVLLGGGLIEPQP